MWIQKIIQTMTPHVMVNQTSQFLKKKQWFLPIKTNQKNLLLLIFSNFAIMMKFTTLLSTFIPLVILQNDDLENVSNSLKVTHYDCSSMQENKMYALNQVAPCKVNPENFYTTDSTISVYQRSYRTYVNAVMCKIKTFPIRIIAECGHIFPSFTI